MPACRAIAVLVLAVGISLALPAVGTAQHSARGLEHAVRAVA